MAPFYNTRYMNQIVANRMEYDDVRLSYNKSDQHCDILSISNLDKWISFVNM